jgi:hypothetical protein
MKKTMLFIFILTVLLAASCAPPTTSESKSTSESTYQIEQTPLLDALHFSTEEEMVKQINSGEKTDSEHQLETIRYYFRLKELPDGAKLYDIRVKAFYIALDYVIGHDKPDMKTNMITFVWYRTMFGDDMQLGFTNSGIPWEPMTKNSSYSFDLAENWAFNEKGEQDKSLPKVQECYMIMWVQDNHDFQVNAPLWFTEDDALKYCVAEKVEIN